MLSKEDAEKVREQLISQLGKFPAEQVKGLKEQVLAMNSEQLEKFISSQNKQQQQGEESEGGECLFCQIAENKIETIKIYEDNNVIAMLDIAPANPGHVIVMPKQHYQFIFQLPDQLLWELVKVVKLILPSLVNAAKAAGVNVIINQGEAAGQRLPHLAINLIPRFDNDGLKFEWERKQSKKEELAVLANEIISRMQKVIKSQEDEIRAKEVEKKQEEKQKYPRRMP